MRHLPKLTYSGLTIILSNPSRFDLKANKLISGYADTWFDRACLGPDLNRYQCDIRTLDTLQQGFLANTHAVLLLGEKCLHFLNGYNTYGIGEQRGCPLQAPWSYPTIVSYLPQDALDIQNYEGRLNPQSTQNEYTNYEKESDDKHRHGQTSRGNFKFWLARDTKKISSVLPQYRGELLCSRDSRGQTGSPNSSNEAGWKPCIYPRSDEVVNLLTNTKNDILFFDIETDPNYNIRCFSFCYADRRTYVVPVIRHDYSLAYSDSLPQIFRALAIAIRDNRVVIHNALFDLFVLAYKYHIPCGADIYDTMLAQSRCFVSIEKSLGHATSLWTWEPYHKGDAVYNPQNQQQEEKLWNYNAKDVYVMVEIYRNMEAYASRHLITESIKQVNASIRPYLINSLLGMKYDQGELANIVGTNDRYLTQYRRMIKLLTGVELLPTSSKSCVRYFHDMLGYPTVARSPKTQAPSLDETALWTLKTKHPDNPVIDLCVAYREKVKENGQLKFTPWKDNRITTGWKLAGTETFRLSSAALLGRWGTNLQNLSGSVDRIFIPDGGKVFVNVDQAGAEALVVAYLCNDGNFRSLFRAGIKSHFYVCLHLFQEHWKNYVPSIIDCLASPIGDLPLLPDWPKLVKLFKADATRYFIAKKTCHASNYGMKAGTFQHSILKETKGKIALSKYDSEKFLYIYHTLFPEIHKWHHGIASVLNSRNKVLYNLQGFPREFYCTFSSEDVIKEAIAWVPQSTVGTITNIAFTQLQSYIELNRLDWDLLNNKHDSYLIQCPESDVEQAVNVMKDFIQQELTAPDGTKFRMGSEASVGYNWGKYDKEYNPKGLKEI